MKTEEKPSNPFAYPVTDGTTFVNDGMTLRDHFAGLALNAVISNAQTMQEITKTWNYMSKCTRIDFEEAIAKLSFTYSDAMLKQREQ